jgi:hypothetical protein
MLGNVINTVRRTGATIVVGYFWLGMAWFPVKPHLPGSGSATGALATAYRLSEALAKPGVVLVGTMLAYLIGIASQELLMPILRVLPLPRNARTLFLPGPTDESSVRFTTETTTGYAVRGLLPAQLYDAGFRPTYERLCAEARFLWAAPVPLIVLGVYLSTTLTPLAAAAVPFGLVLMVGGWLRFRAACRMLRQGADRAASTGPERLVGAAS